ncbi:uncharacterized protein LOC133529796 isoform X2 [Cydia pomonella]|nr:uncharacterized protein LOC133529796 isoform X2 [Cydia pomonella]
MLDDFEAADCTRCKLIKCRCEPNGPTPPLSITGSIPSVTGLGLTEGRNEPISPRSFAEATALGGQELKSPPAINLPRPEFHSSSESNEQANQPIKDVESWVRASTPNPNKTESPGSKPYASITYSWAPAPRSVWNDYKDKINRPEINTATVSQSGNVQDFFKSFNVNMYTVGDKSYVQNRALMQKLKIMASKQSGYTYF